MVSTSNLVSSENEKTTAACNFQTMAMNSFVTSHDLMKSQIGGIWCKHKAIHSFAMAEPWKSALINTHRQKALSKPTSNKLKEKTSFTLKMYHLCKRDSGTGVFL